MAAITSTIAAVAAAAAPVVGAISGAVSVVQGTQAAQAQAAKLKAQQKKDKEALAKQKATQLTRRKELIKQKRRQLFGTGDRTEDQYSIGSAGAIGAPSVVPQLATAGQETLTGGALG